MWQDETQEMGGGREDGDRARGDQGPEIGG